MKETILLDYEEEIRHFLDNDLPYGDAPEFSVFYVSTYRLSKRYHHTSYVTHSSKSTRSAKMGEGNSRISQHHFRNYHVQLIQTARKLYFPAVTNQKIGG